MSKKNYGGDYIIWRPKLRGGDIKFWIGAFVMKTATKVQKLVLKGESCWLTSSHLGQTAEAALVIIRR
jgi:hypothetical protein